MIITQSIPNFSKYGVTMNGEVYSFRKKKFKKCNHFTDRDGYLRFMLYNDNNERKSMASHRLVYSAFIGKLEDGLTIDHLDGIKSNNHVTNLEQVSSVENCKRFFKNNTVNAYNRKLSVAQASEAKELRTLGMSYQKIANKYGVHWSTIHAIVTKNYYKESP